jgi:UDP-glucose 4-epimerase
MKILITGHMGFIGSYLIKEFDAIGLDLKNGNDILNCELPEVDVVIHLAAKPGVVDSISDLFGNAHTNILGTIRLAEAYKNKRFIFASSGGTIQKTIESPYGLSKFCAEEYIKLICKDYVILRYPNVYGKNSRSVIDKFINDKILTIYGDGNARRTFVHINDIVEATLMSIEWNSGTYHCGGLQNYSINELAEITRKEIEYSPNRPGELVYSSLRNTTPNWSESVDVIDYMKKNLMISQ